MSTLGPLLFVLFLGALATAGLTGFGMQDTRDTTYTLVCNHATRTAERRVRAAEPVPVKRASLLSRFVLPALAHRRVAH